VAIPGSNTRLGLTARQWIKEIDLSWLGGKKQPAPEALRTLQSVDKKTFKQREHEMFRPWIKGLIPTVDPDGKALSNLQQAELLDFCEQHQAQFLTTCKSLEVEDALMAARISDPKRRPQRSDGIDLMHAIIALAYCDVFLA
jgi:hypothetical protein